MTLTHVFPAPIDTHHSIVRYSSDIVLGIIVCSNYPRGLYAFTNQIKTEYLDISEK